MKSFEEANKKVHKVEDQWHYKVLVEHGFIPQDTEAEGFVRSYKYKHANGRVITCTTGSNADYFADEDGVTSKGTYWQDLAVHLSNLVESKLI